MSLARLLSLAQQRGIVEPERTSDGWDDLVARVTADVRASLADEQLAFLDDPCRWRVACCARQCGKTFTAARLMVLTAMSARDRIVVYVSDTWHNARKAMWDDQLDGIPAVLHSLGLSEGDGHYRVNLSNLTVTFANGSFIELAGADRGAWAKFRGRKIDLLVADEMQRQDQDHLALALRKDVPDCLMARRGSFVGLGTVGTVLRGIWWQLNCQTPKGWTAHAWTARDLSHLTNVWAEQLAYAEAMGIDKETDPEWLREKMGEWVRDESLLVHTVTDVCLWDGGQLPELIRTRCPEHGHFKGLCACSVPRIPRSQECTAYAGLDLGAGEAPGKGDPCAVVVGTISREEGILREVHSEQRYVPDSADMAGWLRHIMDRYGVRVFYVDPAWKLTGNDLRRLHSLPIEPAVKGDAEGTTEDMWHTERRTALRQGTMLIVRDGVLHRQLEAVQRDLKELERGRIRAAGGQDDHVYDSWRYLFRMVRTRHVQMPEPPTTPEQRAEAEQRAHRERLMAGNNRDGRRTITRRT